MPSKTSEDSHLSVRCGIISSIFHFSPDFDPFLSYLAINYMDRFLATHSMLFHHLSISFFIFIFYVFTFKHVKIHKIAVALICFALILLKRSIVFF
ncbi:hypothetical protein PHJA_002416000 [Phtheirospermum japonicum]|uniref:Uncharacterized protein n=1 Tax=Phtheirospermum japonicum TaxID=374723 RepID=A0A830CS82_9LAMI|nr:hypothetical protein PHJA_002416000 [Phtheirospermum japonicum]